MRARRLRRRLALLRVLESTIATLTGGLILWWVTNPGLRPARVAPERVENKAVCTAVAPATGPAPIIVEKKEEPSPAAAAPLLSLASAPQAAPALLPANTRISSSPAPVSPILLYEDFAGYADGAATDWGKDTTVKTGLDHRKWLVSYVDGSHAVGRSVRLPDRFSFQCRYSAGMSEVTRGLLGWWKDPLAANVSFIDVRGAKHTIQWIIRYGNDAGRLDAIGASLFVKKYYHGVTLPDGAAGEMAVTQPTGMLRIERNGAAFSVLVNGQNVASGAIGRAGQLVGFQIDVVKSTSGSLCFTEFKVSR